MQISPVKFTGFVAALVSVILLCAFFYFTFTLFFKGPQVNQFATVESLDPGAFGPKYAKALSMLNDKSKKIQLSKGDLQFTEGELYKSFTDEPTTVPMTDSRGRDDPFVPYVAP